MKTLNELWEENGCKPIKVRHESWCDNEWFMVMGQSPDGGFFGYDEHGKPDTSNVYSSRLVWSLYKESEEPEELVDHWPAITSFVEGVYNISGVVFPDKIEAHKYYNNAYVRLATEYPPVKLPRRKSKT